MKSVSALVIIFNIWNYLIPTLLVPYNKTVMEFVYVITQTYFMTVLLL